MNAPSAVLSTLVPEYDTQPGVKISYGTAGFRQKCVLPSAFCLLAVAYITFLGVGGCALQVSAAIVALNLVYTLWAGVVPVLCSVPRGPRCHAAVIVLVCFALVCSILIFALVRACKAGS